MNIRTAVCAAALSLGLSVPLAAVQADEALETTAADVRAELHEAMDAVRSFTAEERDTALEQAREALDRTDAEIDRLEAELREDWAGMSESAREAADEQLRDLRHARIALAERFGALEAASDSAWEAARDGFSDAWSRLADAWSASDAEHSAD